MLPGFNTNVRHRGVLFHVQTEDSGRNHPHVITHLYHGGTILASEKSSYRELLESGGDLNAKVRALMEGQHAAMLKRLRAGEIDDVLAERLGPEIFSATKAAGASAGHTQRNQSTAPAPSAAAAPAAPAAGTLPPRPSDDRPLDELILDYLVDHTRRLRRQRAAKLESKLE